MPAVAMVLMCLVLLPACAEPPRQATAERWRRQLVLDSLDQVAHGNASYQAFPLQPERAGTSRPGNPTDQREPCGADPERLPSPSHEPPVIAVLAVALQRVRESARPLLPLSRVGSQASAVEREEALALLYQGRAEPLVGIDERRVRAQFEQP